MATFLVDQRVEKTQRNLAKLIILSDKMARIFAFKADFSYTYPQPKF